MKLALRTVATGLGIVLMALGVSDVVFVLLTHAPWVPHAGSEVGSISLGVGLLWWSRRPSAGGSNGTAHRSRTGVEVAEVSDRAAAVLAVTLGSVLLLIGVFLGLLFSIVFGAVRGIEVFLAPWGVAGGVAIGVGGSRLVSIIRSERTADRALMAIARTAETSRPFAITGPTASDDAARLLGLHQEAVDTVRRAYETSLPSLRVGVWSGVLVGLFAVAFLGWVLASGAVVHGPFPPEFNDAITVAVIAFLAFAGVAQSVGRLRALELARADLTAGRVPEEWSIYGRIPLRILLGFLRHPFSSPGAPWTEPEDSLLASSLTLLRFGQRLATRVRALHIAAFLLIFFVGSGAALFSATILLLRFIGPSAPFPLIIAAEWGPVLAVMSAAVVYLRRRLGSVDEVSRRLAQLATAEIELARAFWSRF